MNEEYTPENLESIAAELPKWAARLGADLYHCIDAWAADRQRIRELETDLAGLRGYKQGAELSASCARREMDCLREENRRLISAAYILCDAVWREHLDMGASTPGTRIDSALRQMQEALFKAEAKGTPFESRAEPQWHTATGERPAEIDGYPLGDMDAVEWHNGVIGGESPARDLAWRPQPGKRRLLRYRRVYLDGVPCVVDNGSLPEKAVAIVTANSVTVICCFITPRWIEKRQYWRITAGQWQYGTINYAAPGDPALSLRRVWREQPC